MKSNLIFILLPILFAGCGDSGHKPDISDNAAEKDPAESAIEWSQLQTSNGDAHTPNSDKPFSGWAKRAYGNGQLEVLAEFTDGTITRLQQWQENGIPKFDIGYTQGKVSVKAVPIDNWVDSNFSNHHGFAILYDENGQKMEEGNYQNGKLEGLYTFWYENGQKESKVNFQNDKLISAEVWKPNGEKCTVSNLVNRNGVVVLYEEDGSESERITIKEGEIAND